MHDYVDPDASSAALLTIDVQRDFTDAGALAEIEGTRAVVPRLQRLVDAFRSRGAPIVHVVRLYRADGSNVDRCRRAAIEDGAEIVRPGSEGAELVAELKPSPAVALDPEQLLDGECQQIGPEEWIVYKPRWSAFYETPLQEHLDERGVDTVVVCGCNFPNCPRATIYDASARDYRIAFVPEATSQTYERGVEELADVGVAIQTVDEAVTWIDDAS